jgi:hypothetical protein
MWCGEDVLFKRNDIPSILIFWLAPTCIYSFYDDECVKLSLSLLLYVWLFIIIGYFISFQHVCIVFCGCVSTDDDDDVWSKRLIQSDLILLCLLSFVFFYPYEYYITDSLFAVDWLSWHTCVLLAMTWLVIDNIFLKCHLLVKVWLLWVFFCFVSMSLCQQYLSLRNMIYGMYNNDWIDI